MPLVPFCIANIRLIVLLLDHTCLRSVAAHYPQINGSTSGRRPVRGLGSTSHLPPSVSHSRLSASSTSGTDANQSTSRWKGSKQLVRRLRACNAALMRSCLFIIYTTSAVRQDYSQRGLSNAIQDFQSYHHQSSTATFSPDCRLQATIRCYPQLTRSTRDAKRKIHWCSLATWIKFPVISWDSAGVSKKNWS